MIHRIGEESGQEILRLAQAGDYPQIACLIALQNQDPEKHCLQSASSEDPRLILAEIVALNDQDELIYVIAEVSGQITGCLGCDFERRSGRGWMRGPFMAIPRWEHIPAALLGELLRLLPPQIRRLDSFLNEKNRRGQQFYLENGFEPISQAHVYDSDSAAMKSWQATICSRLDEFHFEPFIALHQLAFPKTYLDGAHIIQQIDEDHQVFLHGQGKVVNGYVYASIDPHTRDGLIEYLAVQPEMRGQGIGLQLLNCAMNWCFLERGTSQVVLVVDDKLVNARAIYERAGFRLRYSGVNQRKEF